MGPRKVSSQPSRISELQAPGLVRNSNNKVDIDQKKIPVAGLWASTCLCTHVPLFIYTHTHIHITHKYFLQSYLRTEGRNKQKPKIASKEQSQGSGLAALLKSCPGAFPSKSKWVHSVPTSSVQVRPRPWTHTWRRPCYPCLPSHCRLWLPQCLTCILYFMGVPCCRFIPLYLINFNKWECVCFPVKTHLWSPFWLTCDEYTHFWGMVWGCGVWMQL